MPHLIIHGTYPEVISKFEELKKEKDLEKIASLSDLIAIKNKAVKEGNFEQKEEWLYNKCFATTDAYAVYGRPKKDIILKIFPDNLELVKKYFSNSQINNVYLNSREFSELSNGHQYNIVGTSPYYYVAEDGEQFVLCMNRTDKEKIKRDPILLDLLKGNKSELETFVDNTNFPKPNMGVFLTQFSMKPKFATIAIDHLPYSEFFGTTPRLEYHFVFLKKGQEGLDFEIIE